MLAGNWATYHAPGRNDQYQLIQLGQCVYHGGTMYADCWENKPPGIAWLNALGFVITRGQPVGPWILPGILEVAMLVGVWAALRRIVQERTARKAVLVTALVYSLRLYDTPSINPDFYASIFELAAIALLIRGAIPPLGVGSISEAESENLPVENNHCTYSYALCLLAGLLWAAATSFKQIGCVGLLVLTLWGIVAALSQSELRAHVLKTIGATWAGFLIGVGVVAGVLWRQGTLHEAWQAIYTFNTGLLNADDFLAAIGNRARLKSELAPLVLPLWLALTGVIMSFWYRRFRGFPLSLTFGLVLWWAAAVVLAAMGPSRSMRYWQATFPPMLILAAVGLYYIQLVQDRLAHPERLTAFVVAATAAVLLARPAIVELRAGLATSLVASSDHPTEREQLIEIGDRVRSLVGQDDSIYVLDYRPAIYVYADRPAAARFNYPRTAEQWSEILGELQSGNSSFVLEPGDPSPEFRRFCDASCEQSLRRSLERCRFVEKLAEFSLFSCKDFNE